MSHTIFRERAYRFFFFSREEARLRVHVYSQDGEAKFWLEPELKLARNYRFTKSQLHDIETIIEGHLDELKAAWHHHFRS